MCSIEHYVLNFKQLRKKKLKQINSQNQLDGDFIKNPLKKINQFNLDNFSKKLIIKLLSSRTTNCFRKRICLSKKSTTEYFKGIGDEILIICIYIKTYALLTLHRTWLNNNISIILHKCRRHHIQHLHPFHEKRHPFF